MVSICPITGDVNLDHHGKSGVGWVSPLQITVCVLAFVLINILEEIL